jgi:hypothetical protein
MFRTVHGRDRNRAEARIRLVLQIECDPVPCPSCGSYQPDMVRRLKRRYCASLCASGAVLLAVGTAAWGVALGVGFRAWPFVAALPAAGLALLLLWFGLRRRFDPNARAGAEARKAAGKQAEVVPPGVGNGPAFVVAPDGTVSDLRYMNVQSLPSQ